jgi:hypothetical protein
MAELFRLVKYDNLPRNMVDLSMNWYPKKLIFLAKAGRWKGWTIDELYIVYPIEFLVGGLEHLVYFSIYWE